MITISVIKIVAICLSSFSLGMSLTNFIFLLIHREEFYEIKNPKK